MKRISHFIKEGNWSCSVYRAGSSVAQTTSDSLVTGWVKENNSTGPSLYSPETSLQQQPTRKGVTTRHWSAAFRLLRSFGSLLPTLQSFGKQQREASLTWNDLLLQRISHCPLASQEWSLYYSEYIIFGTLNSKRITCVFCPGSLEERFNAIIPP